MPLSQSLSHEMHRETYKTELVTTVTIGPAMSIIQRMLEIGITEITKAQTQTLKSLFIIHFVYIYSLV